jgi:hypothetical protein
MFYSDYKFLSLNIWNYIFEGNTEEENNGYVVIKGNIHGSGWK